MAGRSEQEAGAVVAAYDFTRPRRASSTSAAAAASCSAAILEPAPHLEATLVDRPAAVEAARAHVAEGPCVEGDFFDAVPPGADAYLLSRVLHDWDDEDALRILAVCRAGDARRRRLLIVDAILPERARTSPPRSAWTCTCCSCSARANAPRRSSARCSQRAGFDTSRVHPTDSPAGLAVMDAR